jgi:hypothetical protein
VVRLCDADVLPLRPSGIVRELDARLRDIEGQAGEHLDLGPARAALEDLGAAVAELEALRERATGHNPEFEPRNAQAKAAAALNTALLRLGRILNPVVYSQGGRFAHDPAEWSPIMRPTGGAALPGLAPAAALPGLAGKPEYGFLKAQLIRERNRVTEALRDAAAVAREAGR